MKLAAAPALPGMLLLVAAFSREFAGLRSATPQPMPGLRWAATLELAGERAILVANGAGRSVASAAAREALSKQSVRAVISTGFAGSLDPSHSVGDVFIADSVRGDDGEFATCRPAGPLGGARRGALLTAGRVAQSALDKRELRERGAHAVDMEAAAVAAVAAECGLPFFCIRVISDTATEDLPVDFNRARRADGSISPWNVVGQALCRPARWPGLVRLHRNASCAAQLLGAFLERCEFPCPPVTLACS